MSSFPDPTGPDHAVIDLEEVIFRYDRNLPPVLDIRRLTIRAGEKVFIYGPSGTGKTTLLGLLAGVLPPQRGAVRILGRDLGSLSASARDQFRGNHLGYIFQMFNLIPYLTVCDNILLSADLNPRRKERMSPLGRRAAAQALAYALGIDQLLDQHVTRLSVGQQQRVAAARALLGGPEIIIADEPTSALDYDHRERFLKLLFSEAAKSGATIVFVSHDRQLESLFDRCISLEEVNRA